MNIVRYRALIAVMTGCGLRRFEISDLKIIFDKLNYGLAKFGQSPISI